MLDEELERVLTEAARKELTALKAAGIDTKLWVCAYANRLLSTSNTRSP